MVVLFLNIITWKPELIQRRAYLTKLGKPDSFTRDKIHLNEQIKLNPIPAGVLENIRPKSHVRCPNIR